MCKSICFLFLFVSAVPSASSAQAKILQLSGEVKIRRGVEENWHPASAGMLLEEIDTILTLENAEVVLELGDGATFRLGSNAILDLVDLRKITERELFLYLTAQKIDKLGPTPEKPRLRIANISAVHGESKADTLIASSSAASLRRWQQETNGARALHAQQYFSNAIIKLVKILARYPEVEDCGEVRFYVAKSFEALGQPGQALESYRVALQEIERAGCSDTEASRRSQAAKAAVENLKK